MFQVRQKSSLKNFRLHLVQILNGPGLCLKMNLERKTQSRHFPFCLETQQHKPLPPFLICFNVFSFYYFYCICFK